jgi:hypothetical protein
LKMAISTKTPEVKLKANVLFILKIFFNQKLFKYFLRKNIPI